MHPTTDVEQPDPNHVLISRADEQLAHAYEQTKSADEQLARADTQLSRLERDAARSRPRPSRDRPWLRGLVGLLLAACIGAAAIASQSPYGDALKPIMARWAPQLVPTPSQLLDKSALSAQPSPPSVQAAAAEQAPPQPIPLAQTAPEDVAPTAAQVPPELTRLLQTIMRDLANVEQEIEQLKTSQAQMAGDNAKVAEQVKASQEQMARIIAGASGKDARPNTPAPPVRPIATPKREPARTLPSPQATARPQAPPQQQAGKP